MVLAEAAATLSVLAATLALHWRTQPYAHRHQNVAEMALGSTSMLAVLIGCVFYAHRTRDATVSMDVLDASLLGMLLGPVLVYGTWLAVGGRRHVVNASEMHRCSSPDDERAASSRGRWRHQREQRRRGNLVFAPTCSPPRRRRGRPVLLQERQASPSSAKYTADASGLLLSRPAARCRVAHLGVAGRAPIAPGTWGGAIVDGARRTSYDAR